MRKGLLLFLLVSLFYSFSGVQYERLPYYSDKNERNFHEISENYSYVSDSTIRRFEIPEVDSTDHVIFHTGFTLSYNDDHKQAIWVAYELLEENMDVKHKRTDNFRVDPNVKNGTATNQDYRNSGYDRGHLAPASDMSWSIEAMSESFYYSNISPQLPGFNRGIWKRLETLARRWAKENEAIYIVTGPILTDSLETIGENCVSIPQYFYKVILDYREPVLKGIAFIIPNAGSGEPLQTFAVTIDSVQKITGINFFPLLSQEEEESLEKKICIECWSW